MFRRIFVVVLFALFAVFAAGCGALNTVLPIQTATPAATDYARYEVRTGDTLAGIAARYHVTIEQLIALNSETYPMLARDPSLLQPGWQLRVPAQYASPTARATAPPAATPLDLDAAAKDIVNLINTARAQQGFSLLERNAVLTHIAEDRSADMIARNYFNHYDPQTGQEPLLRYLQANSYAYAYAGENIAEVRNGSGLVLPWLTVAARYSAPDLASEFAKDWLNSPEHRANIFSQHYRRTGVGIAVGADGQRIVATQAFSD